MLRWLWEHHGAPKLDHYVRRYPGLRPRNVTAHRDERDALLSAAPPYLRLFLLLCSDLGIRSGTTVRIAPEHYDPQRRTLNFTTKYGEKLTMPTTAEIEVLLDDCDQRNPEPFVLQLWRSDPKTRYRSPGRDPRMHQHSILCTLKQLRLKLGITRKLTPHDFRRASAVAVLEYTGDIRDVQAFLGHRNLNSTVWYLDHNLRPVQRNTLEAIKKPFLVPPPKERTA